MNRFGWPKPNISRPRFGGLGFEPKPSILEIPKWLRFWNGFGLQNLQKTIGFNAFGSIWVLGQSLIF